MGRVKLAPGKARVRVPPAGLWQEMLNWLGRTNIIKKTFLLRDKVLV